MQRRDGVHEQIARTALATYAALSANGKPRRRSNRAPEWTVLAAVCLYRAADGDWDARCVSLGTGLKALPHARLPVQGDVLHDSHAEVIARRGFKRWLYGQLERALAEEEDGARDEANVLIERVSGREWRLKEGWKVGMYISTLPSQASSSGPPIETARSTASEDSSPTEQHPSLAVAASLGMHTSRDASFAAADSSTPSAFATPVAPVHRGRAAYSALSILRTKPGRADSPPTTSHSCSDKLALWSLLGLQSGLLAQLGVRRLPLECVVVGGFAGWEEERKERIRAECARALGGRLEAWAREIGLGEDEFRTPEVAFAEEEFDGAREVVAVKEALSYVADAFPPVEVITNGIRQGASPKRKPGEPLGPKIRSRLCKLSLFQAHVDVLAKLDSSASTSAATPSAPTPSAPSSSSSSSPSSAALPSSPRATSPPSATYFTAKHLSPIPPPALPLAPATLAAFTPGERYTLLKSLVRAPGPPAGTEEEAPEGRAGPFAGWLVSGGEWESFDAEGRVREGEGV
ncbi:hypothetical protein JCM10450v2_003502 [Rhodotorula kratochvilovae]